MDVWQPWRRTICHLSHKACLLFLFGLSTFSLESFVAFQECTECLSCTWSRVSINFIYIKLLPNAHEKIIPALRWCFGNSAPEKGIVCSASEQVNFGDHWVKRHSWLESFVVPLQSVMMLLTHTLNMTLSVFVDLGQVIVYTLSTLVQTLSTLFWWNKHIIYGHKDQDEC